MLVLLPPAAVPPAVGLGLLIGNAVDCVLGRVPPAGCFRLCRTPGMRSALPPCCRGRGAGDRLRPAPPPGSRVRSRVCRRSGELAHPHPPGRRRPRSKGADAGGRARLGGRRRAGTARIPRRDRDAAERSCNPVRPAGRLPAEVDGTRSHPAHRSGIPPAETRRAGARTPSLSGAAPR